MKAFYDFLSDNPVFVIGVIIMTAIFIKEVVEFYSWGKNKLQAWYDTKRNGEIKDENLTHEIDDIKSKLKTDYTRIQKAESHLFKVEEAVGELKSSVKCINDTVISIRIEMLKKTIIDATGICIDLTKPVSADLYNSVFSAYEEYEEILSRLKLANGKTEMSMKLIKDSWIKRAEAGMFSEQLYLPPAEAKKKLRESSATHIEWWEEESNETA